MKECLQIPRTDVPCYLLCMHIIFSRSYADTIWDWVTREENGKRLLTQDII